MPAWSMVAGGADSDRRGEIVRECLKILAADAEDEPRLGAELADAHRDRILQALRDLRPALAQRAGQDEDRD